MVVHGYSDGRSRRDDPTVHQRDEGTGTVRWCGGRLPAENGRLFGLLNMAMADGYIGSWHTKFDVYKFWRPGTAIQLAGTDGDRRTEADPTWTPLVTTLPIPDYDSSGEPIDAPMCCQGCCCRYLER
jgi:hypothetical protein